MAISLNLNAVNQIEKGSVLYTQNQQVDTISLVLKGRVLVYNNGVKTVAGSGSFLGISDFYQGTYLNNYVAYDNLVIFVFSVSKKSDIETILNVNKDYPGLMVAYLNKYLFELDKTMTSLRECVDSMYEFLKDAVEKYQDICKKSGHMPVPIRRMEDMEAYESDSVPDQNRVSYYAECSKIPNDILKDFFSYSNKITLYQVCEQADIISNLNRECSQLAIYGAELFEALINNETDCLYKALAKATMDVNASGGRSEELMALVDATVEKINATEKLFLERVGYKLTVDRDKMEEIYFVLITGEKAETLSSDIQMKYSAQDTERAVAEMKDSLSQILAYAEVETERADEITKLIIDFNNLRDKTSMDDHVRMLRKRINDAFYELYFPIFLKAHYDANLAKPVELFLNYGFIDEKLLTKEQCLELYFLNNEDDKTGPCKVYNIRSWLTEIFEGRKAPSKSEFDLDYAENLRELKKSSNVSKEEEHDYLTNPIRKVEYEVKNMFRYNNRIANGQISIFVPILCSDNIITSISKMFVTTNAFNAALKEILAIDYSAFYREVLFYDEVKQIKKEYIMKEVFPDIILLPTVGYNSIMWQEIDGKKRDTSGRFMFPIFCEGDLSELIVKAVGRFRFELCRTIQGTNWNNIQEKSLTSEYVDYIQFYRKNRELSPEKKEKLKAQIAKGKNNMREIFLLDYVLWVKSESQSAVRLNKVAREILATYCPFEKSIREKQKTLPLFEEATQRYNREKLRMIKEYDLRFRALQKENIEIPEELRITEAFYKNL